MFDFSKAIELLEVGLERQSAIADHAPGLMDLLSKAGIDASQLDGLSFSEITSLLSEHGIDPAAIAGGQWEELLTSVSQTGPSSGESGLAEMISKTFRF